MTNLRATGRVARLPPEDRRRMVDDLRVLMVDNTVTAQALQALHRRDREELHFRFHDDASEAAVSGHPVYAHYLADLANRVFAGRV